MPRSFGRWLPVVALSAALMAASGCGDDTTTPTDPTPVPVTETFTGTINPNGAVTHTFVSQRSGSVAAGLLTVSPDSTVVLGMGLGTWNGVTCEIVVANDRALQGSVVSGTATAIGNLCVRLFDVGNFTEPVTYEVRVEHP